MRSVRPVRCTNGCGQKMIFRNVASHLNKTCPLRSVECRLGCTAMTSLTGQAHHEAHECPKRLVACVCGVVVVAEERREFVRSLAEAVLIVLAARAHVGWPR